MLGIVPVIVFIGGYMVGAFDEQQVTTNIRDIDVSTVAKAQEVCWHDLDCNNI